jgi:predicted NACHT family NTPase
MDRIVGDLTPSRRTEEARPRYFSEYMARPNIVLLGDPGAGKSHLFRTFAGTESGRYLTVRSFLAMPVRTQGETLFIDGLDERRAGRGDRNTVDALVTKLFEAAPAKVRLSCRVADWLGESDLASLRPFFDQSGGEPAVLGLAMLSGDERRAVLAAQGLNATEAATFLHDAEERGLGDFLENPQNLLMLLKAVRSGQWPATRKALFELSTALMLEEADVHHARAGSGVYSVNELRPVAGAVFAAKLISDVDGIGLPDQGGTESVPGYRSLSFLDRDLVRAALTRRVFVGGTAPESVDYAHRTTAEFLGAAWLADAVRGGLPFSRLQALLGIDGHPAPELRGLHAWLAVHLPEGAGRIIDADPYGVLTYGDAASLSRSNCAHLVQALGRLSQADPWFRSEQWGAPAIGALSRADMVDEFRGVMSAKDAGFGIRSIVAEALALGAPQPMLKDDIAAVLVRTPSTYSERHYAMHALLRLGAPGKAALIDAYHNGLGKRANDLRLRVNILQSLYGDPFVPSDLVSLIEDIWSSPEELTGGVLSLLADALPLSDLSIVLDGIRHRKRDKETGRRNGWEIARLFERILIRAWNELADIEPGRALNWLGVRHAFRVSYTGNRDEFSAALRAKPERLAAITNHFFETFRSAESQWLDFQRFQEMTLHLVRPDDMLTWILDHVTKAEAGSAEQKFLYEAAFPFTWHSASQQGFAMFAQLYALGDTHEALRVIRSASVSASLPERYLERRLGRDQDEAQAEEDRAQHRVRFEAAKEQIRIGAHAGWLGFLAKIYFGMFSDLDAAQTPQQRLAFIIGPSNVPAALEGLSATLKRTDLPVLEDVVALAARHRVRDWWYAAMIAIYERFAADNDLSAFSDELLSAALAIDLTSPVSEMRDDVKGRRVAGWKTAALEQRPDLVRDAYVAVARARLAAGEQYAEGLRELLTEAALKPYRAVIVIEFLRSFPNANFYRLNEMLDGVLATPEAHAGFLGLASSVLAGAVAVDAPQRDQWLVTAYLLAPMQFENAVEVTARSRPGLIFDLRDLSGGEHGRSKSTITLTLPQLEFISRLTGTLHPYVPHPTKGWSGDTNAWDAADYFNALVNAISAISSEAATAALARLESNPALVSYRPFLLSAKARQLARRRETEYDRPDWPHTLNALANGPPATVADLHAILVAHLEDVHARIARANTDQFKAFWNLDPHARPQKPRPEEACRDTLVDLLRMGLVPLGIIIEPEGHMARDKRADISAAMPGRKILCELKRDHHPDVWTAAETQLERFYVHDPDAHGFGVYVVFWFGAKRPRPIPAPPGGRSLPNSAAEMAVMLRALLPKDRAARIAVLVIDVSGETSETTLAKPKRHKPKRTTGANKRRSNTRAHSRTKPRRRAQKSSPAKKRAAAGRKRRKLPKRSFEEARNHSRKKGGVTRRR